MRALVCFVSIASSAVVHAELHVSMQPTLAILSRSTSIVSLDDDAFGYGEPETMSGTGVGGRVELGAAGRISPNVKLGAMLRFSYQHFDVRFFDGATTMREEFALRPVQFGPQITVHRARLYIRGDLTLGTLPDVHAGTSYIMHSDGAFGLVGIGSEVGYQLPLNATWSAQFGLGASFTTVRSYEDGDFNEYIDRTRIFAFGATVSVVVK